MIDQELQQPVGFEKLVDFLMPFARYDLQFRVAAQLPIFLHKGLAVLLCGYRSIGIPVQDKDRILASASGAACASGLNFTRCLVNFFGDV